VPHEEAGMAYFENGFALSVGMGGDLPVTVDDAHAISRILRDEQRCAYPDEHVRSLLGDEATRDGILQGFDWLAEQTRDREDATVVVYFSGHGTREHFLVGARGTLISPEEIRDKLAAIRARKLLVLLDCCYAAGVWDPREDRDSKEPWQKRSTVDPGVIEMLRRGAGRVVLASSRRNQTSFVGRPYSVFTTALVEALSGNGAAENDGYVRLTDLIAWVGARVRELTRNHQHVQVPVADFRGADNFAVSYYGGGDRDAKGVPKWVQPPEPLSDLMEFPPGPRVPDQWFPDRLVDEYATLYATDVTARAVLRRAIRRVQDADPRATVVRNIDVCDIGDGARRHWAKVFELASLHGPRMMAALLMETEVERLAGRPKKEYEELLANMKDPDRMEQVNER
jgi:Caspase domain